MVYKPTAVVFLAAGLWLTSCSGDQARQDALKAEVIKIHDRIMPRTEEIHRAKRDLKALTRNLDSLQEAFPGADTVAIRRQADSLDRALEDADNAMSDWMYEFNVDYTGMEHEDVMHYLEEEKSRIQHVEKAYNESLDGAEEMLKQYHKK